MRDRCFEDFAVGDRLDTPGVTVTESMILDFALRYDPQPFHIDVEAARAGAFGGLIASGFQTLALGLRMVLGTGIFRAADIGFSGFDELRWLRPVRPGDTLRTQLEIVETKPSPSRPDCGIARIKYWIKNQNGEDVLTLTADQLLKRRPA